MSELASQVASTMRGDATAAIIGLMQSLPKPWAELNDQQRRDIIQIVDASVGSLIGAMAQGIAASGMDSVMGTVLRIDGGHPAGVDVTLRTSAKAAAVLMGALQETVVITAVADARFMGQRPQPMVSRETTAPGKMPVPAGVAAAHAPTITIVAPAPKNSEAEAEREEQAATAQHEAQPENAAPSGKRGRGRPPKAKPAATSAPKPSAEKPATGSPFA